MSIKRIRWRWIGLACIAACVAVALVACGPQQHKGTMTEVIEQCKNVGDDEYVDVVVTTRANFERQVIQGQESDGSIEKYDNEGVLICMNPDPISDDEIPNDGREVTITGKSRGRFINDRFLVIEDCTFSYE